MQTVQTKIRLLPKEQSDQGYTVCLFTNICIKSKLQAERVRNKGLKHFRKFTVGEDTKPFPRFVKYSGKELSFHYVNLCLSQWGSYFGHVICSASCNIQK